MAAGRTYGTAQPNLTQLAVLKPPSTTEKTVNMCVVLFSIRKDVTAVDSEATATPASTSVVVGTVFPTRATPYTNRTEPRAPAKAASGSRLRPCHATERPATTTIVEPRAAPVATPIRYGSASGLRNTPWYVAPDIASVAPASPARSTRGIRTSQMIVRHVAGTSESSS